MTVNVKSARSKGAPRLRNNQLNNYQIKVLKTTYDEWAKDPNNRIALPDEIEGFADSLVDLGLIVRFQGRASNPTYRIRKAGRLRYEALQEMINT